MRSTTASSCRQRCAARFAAKWWGRANDCLSLATLRLYSTHTRTHSLCVYIPYMCTIYCVYCTCVIYVNATKGRGLHVVQWPRLVLCWTIKYPIKKSKNKSCRVNGDRWLSEWGASIHQANMKLQVYWNFIRNKAYLRLSLIQHSWGRRCSLLVSLQLMQQLVELHQSRHCYCQEHRLVESELPLEQWVLSEHWRRAQCTAEWPRRGSTADGRLEETRL